MSSRRLASALRSFTLLGVLFLARPVRAQETKLPDNDIGRTVTAFIEMLNGDDDAVRKFEETYRAESARKARPIEERLKVVSQLRNDLGKLRFDRVLESSELGLVALVHAEKNDVWLTLGFQFEEKPPHKLTGVRVEHAESPEAAAKQYTDWKTLTDLAQQVQADCGAPGIAVAIVRGGQVVDKACAGVREKGKADAIEINDRFHIGSVTKSVTSTMIGKLIELGLLKWDVTLGEALPDIDMKPEYKSVTLRQVMTHRGGIPQEMNFDGPTMTRLANLPGSPTEQRAAYAAEVLKKPPAAPPGTEMRYSNAGYAIAGLVAERAAKKSWEDLIEEYVFKPLGMKTSGFGWPATTERLNQPRGHRGLGAAAEPLDVSDYRLGNFISPAGNVNCSIEDLGRYAAAHLNGLRGKDGALKAETIKRLHEPADGPGERYACGWSVQTTSDGAEMHWHNGSAGTFYATVSIFPKEDLAVVFLANAGDDNVETFFNKATTAIRKRQGK